MVISEHHRTIAGKNLQIKQDHKLKDYNCSRAKSLVHLVLFLCKACLCSLLKIHLSLSSKHIVTALLNVNKRLVL